MIYIANDIFLYESNYTLIFYEKGITIEEIFHLGFSTLVISKGIYGSPSYVKFKGFSLMKNPNYRELIFKKNYKDKDWKIKFTALQDSVLNELRIELTFKKFMEAKISITYLRDFLKDMNTILFVKRSIEIFEHLVIYKK